VKKIKKMLESMRSLIEIIVGAITVIGGAALFIFFKRKQNERIDEDIKDEKDNITKAEGVIEHNNTLISDLEDEEDKIERKIEDIRSEDNNEELDDFFNNRGF
jgi:hypothetical protein